MQLFPGVQFYDYSKYPLNKRTLSNNYDLTYSLAENNWDKAKYYLDNKAGRVSAVFSHNIPETYKGYKVINGDNTDLRFLEPKGVIVGLKFKGTIVDRIKGINSGFVIYNDNKQLNNDTNILIKIIKDNYIKADELRKVTYQYKTDFNQLVIKTVDINTNLNDYELEQHLLDLIPTYHCK